MKIQKEGIWKCFKILFATYEIIKSKNGVGSNNLASYQGLDIEILQSIEGKKE